MIELNKTHLEVATQATEKIKRLIANKVLEVIDRYDTQAASALGDEDE